MEAIKEIPMTAGQQRWLGKGLLEGFFSKLDRKVLAKVLKFMVLADFKKGAVVCQEGERGEAFYLIYRGKVKVSKKGWDDHPTLGTGDYFGEMSLLSGQARTATVVVQETSKLFVLKASDFKDMLDKNPAAARGVEKIAADRRRELASH